MNQKRQKRDHQSQPTAKRTDHGTAKETAELTVDRLADQTAKQAAESIQPTLQPLKQAFDSKIPLPGRALLARIGLTPLIALSLNPIGLVGVSHFLPLSRALADESSRSLLPDDERKENEMFLRQIVRDLNFRFALNAVAGTGLNDLKLNAQAQHFAMSVVLDEKNREVFELIKEDLGKQKGFNLQGFYMQLGFAGTLAATVMKGSVEKDATHEVEHHVDKEAKKVANYKKQELYGLIPQMVQQELHLRATDAVRNSPATKDLSPDVQRQLIQQQVAANLPQAIEASEPYLKQQIDQRVDSAVAQELPGKRDQAVQQQVISRMDDLQLETSIQRLNATFVVPVNLFGNMQENPPGLILLSFGKDHISMGPQLQPNMLSEWENTMGRTSAPERGNTVAATGYASLGFAYAIDENMRLIVNVIGYHDRDPWINAQQYLHHSFQISQQDFNKNQRVAALDSIAAVARFLTKSDSLQGEFWGTVVERFDPTPDQKANGYSFGGRITNRKTGTTLNLVYANSGKAYYNETYGIGVAQQILEKQPNTWAPGLTIYADYRGEVHKAEVSVHNSEGGRRETVAFGTNLTLIDMIKGRLRSTASLVLEYEHGVSGTGAFYDRNLNDAFIGINANAQFD